MNVVMYQYADTKLVLCQPFGLVQGKPFTISG